MTSIVAEYLEGMKLFAHACERFAPRFVMRPGSAHELKQLLDLGVRTSELQMFEAGVFDPKAEATLRVWGVPSIVKECTEYGPGIDIQPLGFVVIGSTHGGDAYALDCNLRNDTDLSPVLLVSHERDWTSADDVRRNSKRVAANMAEFLREAAKGEWPD
ncbi:MAG: hypothetical protein KF805_16760 [Phycisphaeraceae bacterium]|nr:hypothetical protein [Phycisphaeraceae bacterium]